jgi:hypothetical protein
MPGESFAVIVIKLVGAELSRSHVDDQLNKFGLAILGKIEDLVEQTSHRISAHNGKLSIERNVRFVALRTDNVEEGHRVIIKVKKNPILAEGMPDQFCVVTMPHFAQGGREEGDKRANPAEFIDEFFAGARAEAIFNVSTDGLGFAIERRRDLDAPHALCCDRPLFARCAMRRFKSEK